MTDVEDQELEDDGQQHDYPDDCEAIEEYEATFTFTVTGTFRARSKDEAHELADILFMEMDLTGPDMPGDEWENIDCSDTDFYIVNVRERQARQAEIQALIAAEQS
jgi:hypothetical protein